MAVRAACAANETTCSRIVLEADGAAFYERMEASACTVSVEGLLADACADTDAGTGLDAFAGAGAGASTGTGAGTDAGVSTGASAGTGVNACASANAGPDAGTGCAGPALQRARALVHASEKRPFALMDGELLRAFILPARDGASLLLHAHHLAGDGLSLVSFTRDVLDALAGRAPAFKPLLLADEAFLRARAKLPVPVSLGARQLARAWGRRGRSFGWDDYLAIHEAYWSAHESSFSIEERSVSAAKTGLPEGVTVGDLLVAELLRGHPGCDSLGLPVSVREGAAGMGNPTSAISVRHRYDERRSFEENLRSVHAATRRELDNATVKYFVLNLIAALPPTLVDAVVLHAHGLCDERLAAKTARRLGYTGETVRELGLTNLGRVELPDGGSSFTVKDLLFVPPKISYTRDVYGAASFGDKLRLVHVAA